MTEQLPFYFSLSCLGEGNGTPLQCSCLENPRDGGAWWAAVYGVAQSRTRLKWLSSSSKWRSSGFCQNTQNITLKGHLPSLHIFKIHLFIFWLQLIACGILVPPPGIEPAPPASEAQNLNHWTTEKSLHIFNWHLGFYYKLNSGKGYNFHHTVTSENF